MPVLGITGGVATGKSTFTALFAGMLEARVIDADRCVHALLAEDLEVLEAVTAAFGEAVRAPEGGVSRTALGDIVFGRRDQRKILEDILHPRVRERWLRAAADVRSTAGTLLVDIPLLFETEAETQFDGTVLVAASEETQMRRLTQLRGVREEMARQMIGAQLPMQEKIGRATHVVWNEGTVEPLREQAALLASLIAA